MRGMAWQRRRVSPAMRGLHSRAEEAGKGKEMKESYIDWEPSPESQRRLGEIGQVLRQYERMGIRLTLRQLYYQLVTKNIIRNEQREYKRLGTLLSKARLAGFVDWDIIEDRVRQAERAPQWETIQDIIDAASKQFRLPRWNDQPEYVELWCEKDALSSVLDPVCRELHVTLMVNRGYSSSSAMYESARRILREADGRETTVIYLGDFDPSGEDMVRDVRDRLAIFQVEAHVSKLALVPAQVAQYKLPPNPAKMSDSRASGFVARHGNSSYEVDALPPEVLQQLVRSAIEVRMDRAAYESVKTRESELKNQLVALGKKIK